MRPVALTEGWEWARTPAGHGADPETLPADTAWRPAIVPGTVAQAMRAAGDWNGEPPLTLDDDDFWYRTRFPGTGHDRLALEGLATIADVWVNGAPVLRSENMFLAHHRDLETCPENTLHLCFRSLSRWLTAKRGRARWRPRMIQPPTIRFARTTLLGRMPGWCPTIHAIGPWRPVTLQPIGAPAILARDLRATLDGADGVVSIRLHLDRAPGGAAWLLVGDASVRLAATGQTPASDHPSPNPLPQGEEAFFSPSPCGRGPGGGVPAHESAVMSGGNACGRGPGGGVPVPGSITLTAQLRIPNARPWWPHTHGHPHLYPAAIMLDGVEYPIPSIGFRTIELDRGADGTGFALRVNGKPVFCRGACWTTPDLVSLPADRAAHAPPLRAARGAGMNMIRLGGTMLYEADAFYALCDELGLMVWQDFMLSNFDYPKDETFRASLAEEACQFLQRTQPHPSLAVLCGGSEVMQQAAMFGLPRAVWEDGPQNNLLPEICADLRPDIPYVPNSPSGGDWPFQPNAGVTHYYGVGAYQLPLTDARRAGVRFTSECLGFANVPCARTLAETLPVSSTTDPRWKAATPHDPGVAWDFEDIRDHYLRDIFDTDPARLRYEDFERYLDASRAVSCVVMEAVFAEWRRIGSSCAGGLVWQLQDLRPGAGWGVIDSLGRPKPAFHALARAFRPRQLLFTDESLNGLHLHILNETAEPLRATLHLVCLRDGRVPIREAHRPIDLPPGASRLLSGTELIDGFFDITYAYRFGPAFHSVTAAWLAAADGTLIADATHFPRRTLPPREELGLEAALERANGTYWLHLRTHTLAQFVHLDDTNWRAAEEWFHLPPGLERRIPLVPLAPGPVPPPDGELRALNLSGAVAVRGHP